MAVVVLGLVALTGGLVALVVVTVLMLRRAWADGGAGAARSSRPAKPSACRETVTIHYSSGRSRA